jgi:hypothetical protein
MQSRTCILPAFTLGTAMAFGVAALAADLPKEGTFRGTYSGVGTAKATSIGKERLLMTWNETGLQLSNGLFDHTTLQCSGLADFTNGLGQGHGNCVSTDPVGDQIVFSVGPEEKHALDADVAYQSSERRSRPVHRRVSGECQDTRQSRRPCATTTSIHSLSPDSLFRIRLNPIEPPWYATRMPGGVGGAAP